MRLSSKVRGDVDYRLLAVGLGTKAYLERHGTREARGEEGASRDEIGYVHGSWEEGIAEGDGADGVSDTEGREIRGRNMLE